MSIWNSAVLTAQQVLQFIGYLEREGVAYTIKPYDCSLTPDGVIYRMRVDYDDNPNGTITNWLREMISHLEGLI